MGRTYEMSWEGQPNFRWVKMYRGTRYRISCDDLKVPRTKEDSYQAANSWWRNQRTKLDISAPIPEKEQALKDIDRKLNYAANHAPELVADLKKTKQAIQSATLPELDDAPPSTDDATLAKNLEIAKLMGIVVPPDLDPIILRHFFGDSRLWAERFQKSNLVERTKTIGHNLEIFLNENRGRQKPKTFKELSEFLQTLTNDSEVWTEQTDAGNITEQTVTTHYLWLSSKKFSPGRHNKLLGFFRRFVTWLWSQKLLEDLPRNLRDKSHRKKPVHKEVKKFTGVKEALASLSEEHRLWALLGLNCGMTNADLGSIAWENINLKKGTLTRRRVKTGDNPNTPTVTYKLWPEVLELLRQRPKQEGLLFITETDKPLYEARYTAAGKPVIKDLFGKYWQEAKYPISLGKFRSIAASALKKDGRYRDFRDYFLAHAPLKLSDKSYSAEDDKPFFEATDFVRRVVLGIKKH